MNSKIIVTIIILFSICIIVGVFAYLNKNREENQNISNNTTIKEIPNTNNENDKTKTIEVESENKLISNIKVIIDGKNYNAILEENETAQNFANLLPQEFNMNELNENEKYVYLDTTFPTNSYNPRHIETGDIMLYGNNCLVVFYKSFDTSYSYTKIGHIEKLSDLGNKNITIKFEK